MENPVSLLQSNVPFLKDESGVEEIANLFLLFEAIQSRQVQRRSLRWQGLPSFKNR
jgi:hypothetical protein